MRVEKQLQWELADEFAKSSLNSYSNSVDGDWRSMNWVYLSEHYPGKQETRLLRKCWRYAIERGLIETRIRRTQFRLTQ